MKYVTIWLLAYALIIAAALRWGHVAHRPVVLTRDEARDDSLRLMLEGVNAASLNLGQLDSLFAGMLDSRSVTRGLE